MNPLDRLLAVCARLEIPTKNHAVRGTRHGLPTWDGAAIRMPLDAPWLAHEIGHHEVAPPEYRAMANYGFRADPHSLWIPEQKGDGRPMFDPDDAAFVEGADADEEADALWLGALIGAACGLDPADAAEDLDYIPEDYESREPAMERLRARGLAEPGPDVEIVGPWRVTPAAMGGAL